MVTGCGPSSGRKDVVVIGGGLGGLCSAHELRKRGYNVVAILEAQARTGGRVLTLREGFKNNQYAEAGATRIADTHNFTLGYAKEFNLPLVEFSSSEPALYYLNGQRFVRKDGDEWLPNALPLLTPEQRKLGADALALSFKKLDELGDPLAADWPTGKALDYNNMGIEQYLRLNGASDDVITIDRANNGWELPMDGALYWLAADIVDSKWDKTFAIEGGNDRLPKAFTDELSWLVRYNAPVSAIAQDDAGVTVTFVENGVSKTITADLCVCSIPFSVLRKVSLERAGFSAEKMQVINNLSMMPVSRAYLQTKSRFWKQEGIGGLKIARTDTEVERLWDLSQIQPGDSGMLLGYMQGEHGVAFAQQPAANRLKYVLDIVGEYFPQISSELEASAYKIWQDDPWAGGAWGYYKAGEMATMFPASKKSQGRVYFCGEHTSVWSGWMQGALESANRVVKEIDEA